MYFFCLGERNNQVRRHLKTTDFLMQRKRVFLLLHFWSVPLKILEQLETLTDDMRILTITTSLIPPLRLIITRPVHRVPIKAVAPLLLPTGCKDHHVGQLLGHLFLCLLLQFNLLGKGNKMHGSKCIHL